jgi:hypothetical protein
LSARLKVALLAAALLLAVLVATLVVMAATQPTGTGTSSPAAQAPGSTGQFADPTNEPELTAPTVAGADPADPNLAYLPTPLIATCAGVALHSPIAANNITEVEFHQASYAYAIPLESLLTIVDTETVVEQAGTTRPAPAEQPTGDVPLIGSAVSTWRLNSVGDFQTSVDVGALAGCAVYAPVSGTVVKVREYSLYDLINDYEVHIQIPGHPELDVVLLHIDNLRIQPGDTVIAGVTQIATVRDIAVAVDNNLANFTAAGDPGNHAHVQVNNATDPSYKGLEGALDIFQ